MNYLFPGGFPIGDAFDKKVCFIRLHLTAGQGNFTVSQEPGAEIWKLHPLYTWPSLHQAMEHGTPEFLSDALEEEEDCSSSTDILDDIKTSNPVTVPIASPLPKTSKDTKKELHSKPGVESVYMCSVCKEEFRTRPMLDVHAGTCCAQVSGGRGRVKQKFFKTKETANKENASQGGPRQDKLKVKPVVYHRTSAGPEIRQLKKKLNIEESVHEEELKTEGQKLKKGQEKATGGSGSPARSGSKAKSPSRLSKQYKCHFCPELFFSMKERREHEDETHTKLECDICHKSFKSMKHLKHHGRVHDPSRLIPCDICGRVLKGKESLEMHKVNEHNVEGRFKCEICGKHFFRQYALTNHARVHTGEKPYQCSICGKTFPFSASLYLHRQRHTSERKYKCTVCNMSYTTKMYLADHMKKHDPKNHVQCPVCLRMFNSKRNLTVHKTIHAIEGKYKCDICGLSYKHPKSFNCHKKTHMEPSQVGEKGPKKRRRARVTEQSM